MTSTFRQVRLPELLQGLNSLLPAFTTVRKGTGGTCMPAYCYSVWLRHMAMAASSGLNAKPRTVAELGPGDSLGIGLTALLFGAEQYYAFDVVKFADAGSNLNAFEELVAMARQRANIPDAAAFPQLKPQLDDYRFPSGLFSEEELDRWLLPSRLDRIRKSILHPDAKDSAIRYMVPWTLASLPERSSVDAIFSQAVLEHVDNLPEAYRAMHEWLRPDGYMSHQIDFKSHGTAKDWNGHWTYPDVLWSMIRGKRPYLLNREPYSMHAKLLAQAGFSVVKAKTASVESSVRRQDLASRFRDLSEEDLRTSGAYILAVKHRNGAQACQQDSP